ncbi:gamma interferon inducible lysosomal thiol reductase (GILT) domain-containing protein [Phthorimaea operculella]|nr:gamma interferon inducible lysosomal thiol reductase (GILT) domain-containing protein [Phthorimaea operculella]
MGLYSSSRLLWLLTLKVLGTVYRKLCRHDQTLKLNNFYHGADGGKRKRISELPYKIHDQLTVFVWEKSYDQDGTIVIKCQHGPHECYGNKLHACAIDALTKHPYWFSYISCLMANHSNDAAADQVHQPDWFSYISCLMANHSNDATADQNTSNTPQHLKDLIGCSLGDVGKTLMLRKFQDLLVVLDDTIKRTLCAILNIALDDTAWIQASLPIRFGGLGIRKATSVSLPAFLSSAHSANPLCGKVLNSSLGSVGISGLAEAVEVWRGRCPVDMPDAPHVQRQWDEPLCKQVLQNLISGCLNSVDRARILAVSERESGFWLYRSGFSCAKELQIDPEPIKACAKTDKGLKLFAHYGELSAKANYLYVPYVVINGQPMDFHRRLMSAVCDHAVDHSICAGYYEKSNKVRKIAFTDQTSATSSPLVKSLEHPGPLGLRACVLAAGRRLPWCGCPSSVLCLLVPGKDTNCFLCLQLIVTIRVSKKSPPVSIKARGKGWSLTIVKLPSGETTCAAFRTPQCPDSLAAARSVSDPVALSQLVEYAFVVGVVVVKGCLPSKMGLFVSSLMMGGCVDSPLQLQDALYVYCQFT